MSASTNDIRNAIVARLLAVEGIGRVHPFERFVKDAGRLKLLYLHGADLHGWYVQRGAVREVEWSVDENRELTAWRLVGFMAIQDDSASELAFDLVIDRIRAAFRDDEALGGLIEQIGDPEATARGEAGLQVESLGPVMFCGVLCHQARLSLTTVGLRPVGQPVPDDLNMVQVNWDFAEPSTTQGPDGQIDAQDNITFGGET